MTPRFKLSEIFCRIRSPWILAMTAPKVAEVHDKVAKNEKEISSDVLKQIPNRDKIKAVEPEDTLIITYAGHGYADNAGIFYLLPYDIY